MTRFIKLKNDVGTEVILCNVGASIYDIRFIDKDKKMESILYTTKRKHDYPYNIPYLGMTIGRTGGRITDGKFELNGIKYTIPSDDPNGLHGGRKSLSYQHFKYKKIKTLEYDEVLFSYYSPDMESGYPGNLDLKVSYKLFKKENKLLISYNGISDKDTLLNLSNHAYFNLSGNAKNDILDQELFIDSKKMLRVKNALPGEIIETKDIYSFNNLHRIKDNLFAEEIINNTKGYDFPYLLEKNLEYPIILKDNASKRIMKIRTSYPAVVVYTCNYPSNLKMNNNKIMKDYYAVCLECMYPPNSINNPFIEDKKDILRKNEKYDEFIEINLGVSND